MLIGKSVALTAFEDSDSAQLFAWINDPELVRLSAPFRPVHAVSHGEWLSALAADRSRVAFAIRALPARQLIGVVQLAAIDPVHRNAEMIIRIGEPSEQGKGRGSEALKLLLAHAWKDLNLHRVGTRAFATNARAIAAYKKAGFSVEGQLREAAFIDGAWTDLVVMGVLNPAE
jgi:RimJ/RimL family protein N-acetyltransferase